MRLHGLLPCRLRVLAGAALPLAILILLMQHIAHRHLLHEDMNIKTNLEAYLVDSPTCKIPKVDPYDITIRRFVKKSEPLICKQNMSVTYEDGLQLRINWSVINGPPHNGDIRYCRYTPIYRPKYEATSSNNWKFLETSEPFNDSVTVKDDFVRVSCYNSSDKKVYINMHSFIQPNTTMDAILAERMEQHVYEDNIKEHPNVIMIGVDSVSRLNLHRQLTKTRTFLMETLGAFEMMGYNKVADNTFVNMVPMLLGKFVAEMHHNPKKTFDEINLIWKQFSGKGYTTFYAEDAPEIAIFDYCKQGFHKPPTDYYNRPMSLVMKRMKEAWSNRHHCFQDRLETQIVLDYLFNFVNTFRNDSYFALAFISRITHDNVNGAGAVDESYYRLFKKMHDNALLNNTVVFFFSDHGMRYGRLRETPIGKLEERLPFMLVSLPKSWNARYMFARNNLLVNQNRLSTPFDVYETLKDILYFNGREQQANKSSRGVSWFRQIPADRSCDQAGILAHWCTCFRNEHLNITHELVTRASAILLGEIRERLTNYTDVHVCEELAVSEIREATRLIHVATNTTLRLKKAFEDIQLTILTSPGHAVLEATIRIDTANDIYKVIGDISRLNKYGHHGDCIQNAKLRKICHCRV